MKEKIKIRALRADEIEVRVGQVTEKGVSLLLYKDARCDKRILDETFGVDGWANCYSEIKGNLFCSIMLQDKHTGMWIQKQDCGVESNTEKEKGEASDAFKRAGFNVGIGRELYTKIFIFVKVETIKEGTKYKLKNPYEKWYVKTIHTNNETEKIEYLEIANDRNQVVFTYGKPMSQTKQEEVKTITVDEQKNLFTLANKNNDIVKNVIGRYKYEKTAEIKVSDYEQICKEIEAEILM